MNFVERNEVGANEHALQTDYLQQLLHPRRRGAQSVALKVAAAPCYSSRFHFRLLGFCVVLRIARFPDGSQLFRRIGARPVMRGSGAALQRLV
jgi:hypothetical protein